MGAKDDSIVVHLLQNIGILSKVQDGPESTTDHHQPVLKRRRVLCVPDGTPRGIISLLEVHGAELADWNTVFSPGNNLIYEVVKPQYSEHDKRKEAYTTFKDSSFFVDKVEKDLLKKGQNRSSHQHKEF